MPCGNEFVQSTKGVQVSRAGHFSVSLGMMPPLEPIECFYSKELSASFKANKNARKSDNVFSSPALFLSDEKLQAVTKSIPRCTEGQSIILFLYPHAAELHQEHNTHRHLPI